MAAKAEAVLTSAFAVGGTMPVKGETNEEENGRILEDGSGSLLYTAVCPASIIYAGRLLYDRRCKIPVLPQRDGHVLRAPFCPAVLVAHQRRRGRGRREAFMDRYDDAGLSGSIFAFFWIQHGSSHSPLGIFRVAYGVFQPIFVCLGLFCLVPLWVLYLANHL